MNDKYKMPVGIIIGMVAALAIGAIAFKAGQMSNTTDPLSSSTKLPAASTINDQQTTPATNINSNTTTNNSSQTSTNQKVSGKFGVDSNGLYSGFLCFKTTAASSTIAKGTFFCFSNNEEAMTSLKVSSAGRLGYPACDFISGNADITISNFSKPTTDGDSPNSAKLVTVNKITDPAGCSKGTLSF